MKSNKKLNLLDNDGFILKDIKMGTVDKEQLGIRECIAVFGDGRYSFRDGTLPEIIDGLKYEEDYKLYDFHLICEKKLFGAPDNFIFYEDK